MYYLSKKWKATDYVEDDMYDCINSMLCRIEKLERKLSTVKN